MYYFLLILISPVIEKFDKKMISLFYRISIESKYIFKYTINYKSYSNQLIKNNKNYQ